MGDTSGAAMASKLADPRLLDKIDQLFELNIGEYVALPQVCFDLSSRHGTSCNHTLPKGEAQHSPIPLSPMWRKLLLKRNVKEAEIY